MNTSTVAIAAVITGVVAAFLVPGRQGPVAVSYSCNSATFTNNSTETVRVSHGVPASSDVVDLTLAPGQTRTVDTNASNFRWWATSMDGKNTRLVRARTGVDLTRRCDRATVRPTATPTGYRSGGLASTGEKGTGG